MASFCLYSILLACLANISFAGFTIINGRNHQALYNDTNSVDRYRRFPDRTVIEQEDYNYFWNDLNFNENLQGTLLTGALNTLYQLDRELNLVSNYSWGVDPSVIPDCTRNNPIHVCQNHIKTYQRIPSNDDLLLVCGTQAAEIPQCRTLNVSSGTLNGSASNPISAPDGIISYFPDYSGFGEFIRGTSDGVNNRYFSAAFQDGNREYLLSYQNVTFTDQDDPNTLSISQLHRTIRGEELWLRSPVTFVDFYRADYSANEDREFYFVFLRENKLISDSSNTPFEMIYSRVVRLCRNDPGSTSGGYFTSFLKARIFCDREAPSESRSINTLDYQYNEITSYVFNNDEGRYHETGAWDKKMYGAFVGSSIGPTGTALCIYNAFIGDIGASQRGLHDIFTEDVLDYTDRTAPLERENSYSTCDTTRPDDLARNQVETVQSIAQIGESPLMIMDGIIVTQMIVDTKCVITSADTSRCVNQDVLFLGTDQGKIMKLVFGTAGVREIDPIISEEIELDNNNTINRMKMETVNSSNIIFASTDSKIYRVPLERCARHGSMCSSCIGSRDPYCVWNTDSQRCEVNPFSATEDGSTSVPSMYVQNIHSEMNFPVISFMEDDYTVSEGDGTISLTILSSAPALSDIMLQITTSDGTAIGGINFSPLNENIVLPSGNTTLSVSISIMPDLTHRIDTRDFTVSIRGLGSTCVIVENSEVPVIITNNEVLSLGFSASTRTVSEGDMEVDITIQKNFVSSLDVHFLLTTIDGSANAPGDYASLSSQLLTFPALSSDDITYRLLIVDDSTVEANETFQVALSLSSIEDYQGTVMIDPSMNLTTITITNDDSISIGFDVTSYTITEGDSGNVTGTINLLKFGTNDVSVSVGLSLSSTMGAVENEDFVFLSENLVFGSMDVMRPVNVVILSDFSVEDTETVEIEVSPESNVNVLNGRSSVLVTILDEDSVVIGFSTLNYTANESDGSVTVSVSVINGTTSVPLSLTYTTLAAEASEGLDYISGSGTLTLEADGMLTGGNIMIGILDDSIYENCQETFSVVLSTEDDRVRLAERIATVTIEDNDVITVGFSQASFTGMEGARAELQLVLSTSSQIEVTVDVVTRDGSATAPGDYAAVTTTTVTFLAQETMASVSIDIAEDDIFEAVEDFTVVLQNPSYCELSRNNIAQIEIQDNDRVILSLQRSTASVMEFNGFLDVVINKIGTSSIDVDFTISTTSSGSAISSLDFIPVSSLLLSFPPGSNATMNYRVSLVNDVVVETQETFGVSLMAEDGRVDVQSGSLEVTIVDDDDVFFGFESSSYTTSESEESVSIKILKLGSSDIPLSILLSVQEGGAGASDVGNLSLSSITFMPSEMERTVLLYNRQDDVLENTEDVMIVMTVSSGQEMVARLRENYTVVYIRDTTVVEIGFVSTEYSVSEGNGDVPINVEIFRGSLAVPVTVVLSPFSDTARALDFDNSSISATFNPGNSATLTENIAIFNDSLFESLRETFLVRLIVFADSTYNNRVRISGPEVASITILDDDTNTFHFASTNLTVNESDCFISLTVLRTGVSEIPIDLFLVLSNLSTSESSSYASSQQFQMTFAPSDTSRVVDIPIIDDVVDEEEDVEMFEVFLMEDMSSNRLSFVSATATVNILDDDNHVVKIECPTTPVPLETTSQSGCATAGSSTDFTKFVVVEPAAVRSIYESYGASIAILIILLVIIIVLAALVVTLSIVLWKRRILFSEPRKNKVRSPPRSRGASPALELSAIYPNQSYLDKSEPSTPIESTDAPMLSMKIDLSTLKEEVSEGGDSENSTVITSADRTTTNNNHVLHVKPSTHTYQHSDTSPSNSPSEHSPTPDRNNIELTLL